jgi:hypothetical protein
MPEKLLPPGVSIRNASEVLLMKVRVESYWTRRDAERIVDANKPFWQGEIREAADGKWDVWKPLAKMSVDMLGMVKRGDLIRLFIMANPPGVPPPITEFVTAVVISRGAGMVLRSKVYSRPEKTLFHSVDYGDELVVTAAQVVSHEQSTERMVKELEPFLTDTVPEDVPVNSDDAKLRAAVKNLPALAPQQGRQYWTRNGTVVSVWTYKEYGTTACSRCGRQLFGGHIQNEECPNAPGQLHAWQNQQRSVWIGGTPDGAAIEWNKDGSHAGGVKDLDIVKDPKMNEVLA